MGLNESYGNEGWWNTQSAEPNPTLYPVPAPNPRTVPPSSAPDPVAIFLNGKKITWGALINGQTWAPARVVGTPLGVAIDWDGKEVLANGKALATLLIDSMGYVPVRELAQAAGAQMEWDRAKMIVTLKK